MKRTTNNPIIMSAVAGLIFLLSATQARPADNFSIEVNDEDIAVEARNASLREILQELEKVTGIPMKFVADTSERVTLNVGLTTIENAIGKITPNHMIVHEQLDGKKVIKEVIIIPDTGGSSTATGSAFLPSGQPAPAIEPSLAGEQPIQQPVQQPANTPNVNPAPGNMPAPGGGDQVN